MVMNDIRQLSSRSRNIVVVSVAAICVYLALFWVNQSWKNRQLAQVDRLAAARETVVDLRAALSQFVLDNIRLGNRRGMSPDEIEAAKKSAQQSEDAVSKALNEIGSFLQPEEVDLLELRIRLGRMRDLARSRSRVLDNIYHPGGFLTTFLAARDAADTSFTKVSEQVPLPTKNFLAAKAAQNEFLAGYTQSAATKAYENLQAYNAEVQRFRGLSQEQRAEMASTAGAYAESFSQLSEALQNSEDLRDRLQKTWVDLLPLIDQATVSATKEAMEASAKVAEQNTNIQIGSVAIAFLTALGFATLASQAHRLALLHDQRLQRAAEQFRDFALASSDMFLEVDALGNIRSLDGDSDFVARIQGAVLHASFIEVMERFGIDPLARIELHRSFTERAGFRGIEFKTRAPDTGIESWYSLSGLPFYDDAGNFAGFRNTARNITEQRKAVADRALAEARLGAIVDNLPVVLFRVERKRDPTAVRSLTFIGPNCERALGLTPDQIREQWDGQEGYFVIAEDRERFKKELFAGLEAHNLGMARGRIRLPDGSTRWIQQILRRVPSTQMPEGERAAEGLWIDVTEEEYRLRQLKDLELAIDTSDQAFYISDPRTGEVTYHNNGFSRLLEYPQGQKKIFDGSSGAPAERTLEDLVAEVESGCATPEGWRGEFAWRLKSGRVIHLLGHARRLSEGRRVTILTDISHRVAQEKELQTISTAVEQASDGVMLFMDSNGPATYANAAFHRIFRLPEGTNLRGQHLSNLLGDLGGEAVREIRRRAEEQIAAHGAWQTQIDAYRADGSLMTLQTRFSRLSDGRILVIATDVTEQVRLEKEIRSKDDEEVNLRRQLADAQRLEAIGSLAGGIAHDFNNIIGAARGFADLLVADLPEGGTRRYAERIVAVCARATSLVREIMAFAQIKDEALKPIDVTRLIEEAGDVVTGRHGAGVAIEIENKARSCWVKGSATQLSQVVSNILINAADATPSSGGKIAITTTDLRHEGWRLTDADWRRSTLKTESGRTAYVLTQGTLNASQDYLRVRVEDQGTGMTESVLRHIFDPFYTTKEKSRGTGLGLAVVASIINIHQGALRVITTPGLGTTFEIYLPLLDEVPDVATNEDQAPPATGAAELKGNERILIVDDEVDIADSLAIALSRFGYETAPVYDPREALEIFTEDPDAWDVVITDQFMPSLRGMQLVQKMKMLKPELHAIICTGHSDALTAAKSGEAGLDAFFNKPVSAATLADAIRRIFRPPAT
jgi:PAS domain S-box-containing protein